MIGQYENGFDAIGLALQSGPAAMSINGPRPAADGASAAREVVLIEFETRGGVGAPGDFHRTDHFELDLPEETPFFFLNGGPAGKGPSSADRMSNFTLAQGDVIDLSSLDVGDPTLGYQSFEWVGDAAFSGTYEELNVAEIANFTVVRGNVYGDGAADSAFRFDRMTDLQVGDFFF
jgi:hypothetical protein